MKREGAAPQRDQDGNTETRKACRNTQRKKQSYEGRGDAGYSRDRGAQP